jgi:hypothetical protein
VGELFSVGKQRSLSSAHEISDGDVIGNDSLVGMGLTCVELDLYVLLVLLKLFMSMREGKNDCL